MLMRAAMTFYFNKFAATKETKDRYIFVNREIRFCHANNNEKTAFGMNRR